jgi:hypothetical protein
MVIKNFEILRQTCFRTLHNPRRGVYKLHIKGLMKYIMAVFLIVLGMPFLFAQAHIRSITGTVELKTQEDSLWKPAGAGQVIENDMLISTGFRSTALLDLGSSTITVEQLSRLSLGEIIAEQGNEQVRLFLNAGRIRADVNPPAAGRVDFSVRSPSVSASVRGTSFTFDTINLIVTEGLVEFSGNRGAPVYVGKGEEGSVKPRRETTFLLPPSIDPLPPIAVEAEERGVLHPAMGLPDRSSLETKLTW